MEYKAIIGKAHIYPHPNADRLQLATIAEEQVVVNLDVKEDDLLIFFPSDGQLNLKFAEANDLISYIDPKTGKKAGGYFAKNCRVRAQRFRGEASNGFACSIERLITAGVSIETVAGLKSDDEFNTLDGIEICRKYLTPKTLRKITKIKTKKHTSVNFAQHVDTKHLPRAINKISLNSLIWITEKMHGTSARYGYIPVTVKKNPNWFQRIFRKPVKKTIEYQFVAGTRRSEINVQKDTEEWYGNDNFRLDFMKDTWEKLHKGEVIYGEIVGWMSEVTTIMPPAPIEKLSKDKILSTYPENKMIYSYGCELGQHKFIVYRITQVNEDGNVIELPWLQVKSRCKELELKHVRDMYLPFYVTSKEDRIDIVKLAKMLSEGVSTWDFRHLREGVVLRVESGNKTDFFKYKSFDFKILEGIIKDNDNYIDLEEVESG